MLAILEFLSKQLQKTKKSYISRKNRILHSDYFVIFPALDVLFYFGVSHCTMEFLFWYFCKYFFTVRKYLHLVCYSDFHWGAVVSGFI